MSVQSIRSGSLKDKFFYEGPRDKVHNAIWETFKSYKNIYRRQHTEWLKLARQYNNRQWDLASFNSFSQESHPGQLSGNRMTLNVAKSLVDIIHSRITSHQPETLILMEKNSQKAEKQVTYANAFLRERRKTLKLEGKESDTFLDSCIYGTGLLLNWFNPTLRVNGKKIGEIEIKRVLPYYYMVEDSAEAENSNWGLLLQFENIKDLRALYPEIKFNVDQNAQDFQKSRLVGVKKETVPVLYFWHRKTEGMPNGRFIKCTNTATLEYEDYDDVELPVRALRYSRTTSGFWGIGVSHTVKSLQIEINKMLWHISQNQNFHGRPRIAIEKGSNVFPESIANGLGYVEYTNKPPTPLVFNPTPPEVFAHFGTLIERAYLENGISLSSVTGEPTPAMRSAAALESVTERENKRFARTLLDYEMFKLENSSRVMRLAKKNYKKDDERWFKVIVDAKRYEKIAFDQIEAGDEDYHFRLSSMSSFGNTKAGQHQTILNYVQAGLIKDPSEILDLLQLPNEDRIFDTVLRDQKIAREENIRMLDGESVEVLEWEDHEIHLKEHFAFAKENKFDPNFPDARPQFDEHIRQHLAQRAKAQQGQANQVAAGNASEQLQEQAAQAQAPTPNQG
jgi:hypothetical protein